MLYCITRCTIHIARHVASGCFRLQWDAQGRGALFAAAVMPENYEVDWLKQKSHAFCRLWTGGLCPECIYIYIYIYPDRPVLKSVCFASSFFPLASLFSFPPSLPLHKPTKTDSYSFLCKPTIVSQSLFLNLHPFFKNLTTHLRLYPNTLNIPNSKQTNRLTFNK